MGRLISFPGRRAAGASPPPGDVAALGSRLQAADVGHVHVDRFLGNTAVASVFAGHDVGDGHPVTLKVVDSDLAYDVGGAEFVRSIGSMRELTTPHVLPPVAGSRTPTGICYVGPYAQPRLLRDEVSPVRPLAFADAVRISMEIARALDRWHALGLAHGSVGWDTLLMQSGQVLLSPPEGVTYGWEARRRDMQAVARICRDMLEASTDQPPKERRWRRLHGTLRRAADGLGPPALSAGGLADRLTEVEYRVTRPGAGRAAPVRRILASLWARLRGIGEAER